MKTLALALVLLSSTLAFSAAPAMESLKDRVLALDNIKVNAEVSELGRKLYFDRRLSGDSTMNCATCHLPGEDGFADSRELSAAYPTNGHFRNTPTTVNAALRPTLTWDGRANGVVAQSLGPVGSPFEMNIQIDLLVEKLRAVPEYRNAFLSAFGEDISQERISEAIGEFEKSLVSSPAPFDKWVLGDAKALDKAALKGMDVFFGKGNCAKCHEGEHFGVTKFESLGLEPNPKVVQNPRNAASLRYYAKVSGHALKFGEEDDLGRYFVTGNKEDVGKFLVPSLRQLKRTAPYFHDGRMPTLRAVIDFHDQGGGKASHRSSDLKPLNLTEEEKQGLEAFLLALTGDDPLIKPPHLPE